MVISGRLAQLVERLLYTQDVGGSIPSPPTISAEISKHPERAFPFVKKWGRNQQMTHLVFTTKNI